MSARKVRRLPFGETTTDVGEYVSAWETLAEPLCKEFGWTLHAFDPGIMFDTEVGVLTLPAVVVDRIGGAFMERTGFSLALDDERGNVETLKLHVETLQETNQLASKEVMRLREERDALVANETSIEQNVGALLDLYHARMLEAENQSKLAWERHAEKDCAYGRALAERDEARVQIAALRSALSSIAYQYHWEDSPAGNLAREALGKGRKS